MVPPDEDRGQDAVCRVPNFRKASFALAFLLGAALLAGDWTPCAAGEAPPTGARFTTRELPGVGPTRLQALVRAERAAPLRYRVIVLPGSGCAGMGPFAERYFAGLLHARVWVLHKPDVYPRDRTPPEDCPADFVQADALSAWQTHARAAVRALVGEEASALPTLLVGISEGAELLPALASEVPHLLGLVLLSASGLDPREAGQMQAERLGVLPAWEALERAQAGTAPDAFVVQGRSLRYWRDLWRWRVQAPLIDGPWPLLQAWGEADALVPPEAYQRFGARAQGRAAPFCARGLPGSDHGLQAGDVDGVQRVWAWLEQWARAPDQGLCTPLRP